MKSNISNYFENIMERKVKNRVFNGGYTTNLFSLHNMEVESKNSYIELKNFEERVYLENEALNLFCDFLKKE